MEYCNNGDLFEKIQLHTKENYSFQESEIWRIFIQIVRGLKVLHDLRIMHRDLKVSYLAFNWYEWRVQMFFFIRISKQNLAIWMFLKWLIPKVWISHKLGLLTMLGNYFEYIWNIVRKFGEMNLIALKVIFGH